MNQILNADEVHDSKVKSSCLQGTACASAGRQKGFHEGSYVLLFEVAKQS